MAATDDELGEMAGDLYKRLGGLGSKDARIVHGLLARWGERGARLRDLADAAKQVEAAYRTRPIFELFGAVDRLSEVLAKIEPSNDTPQP